MVMISASFHDLMSPIYLFYEYEESKGVGQYEVRDTESLVRYLGKELEIYSITPTDHKYRGFSRHLRCLYDIHEPMS